MGVARGGGEGGGWSSPTLPPCGQLTRCFSAVAELLVVTDISIEVFLKDGENFVTVFVILLSFT